MLKVSKGMTRKPDIRSTHDPVDPRAFGDFLRKLERRIEEHWAGKPTPPEPPPDPWENHKPGTLIAAEKDVRLWELIEELELGLCGGHEQCAQAWCRRARRCATIERLRPEMEKSRATLAREQAKWKPPPTPPEPPAKRRRRGGEAK
jgi:hypothetical protein